MIFSSSFLLQPYGVTITCSRDCAQTLLLVRDLPKNCFDDLPKNCFDDLPKIQRTLKYIKLINEFFLYDAVPEMLSVEC